MAQDHQGSTLFLDILTDLWGQRGSAKHLFLWQCSGCCSLQDVVFLQEVWVKADAQLLAQQAAEGQLEYSQHYQSGLFGSGLVLLARYPIHMVSHEYL